MITKKNKLSNNSISKKSAWSLILIAKEAAPTDKKTITISKNIKGLIHKIVYDLEKQKIIKKNFKSNKAADNLFKMYLPIIFNLSRGPYLIGHLAQTLDGFIATKSGESKYISSKENLEHIHMLRAISDIILVGANTVKLDNPKLTTRLVRGKSPMRFILDKDNKLKNNYNVFTNKDGNGYRITNSDHKTNDLNTFQLPTINGFFDEEDIIRLFNKLNKKIVFIEGGGITVSNFYNQRLLNRLHICISPIILGKGKNSFICPKEKIMDNILEHETEYYLMGDDILCDINLFLPDIKDKI